MLSYKNKIEFLQKIEKHKKYKLLKQIPRFCFKTDDELKTILPKIKQYYNRKVFQFQGDDKKLDIKLFQNIDSSKFLLDFKTFIEKQQKINKDNVYLFNKHFFWTQHKETIEDKDLPMCAIGKMLSSIPGGGKSSFTNKVEIDSKIKRIDNLLDIWSRTILFMKYANKLNIQFKNTKNKGNIVIWRSVNYGDLDSKLLNNNTNSCSLQSIRNFTTQSSDNKSYFVHPLPMSCSWFSNLAKNKWQESNCCLLKIIMPTNFPFISLSWPFDTSSKYRPIGFEDQHELVLPPCKFEIQECSVLHRKNKKPIAVTIVKPIILFIEDLLPFWSSNTNVQKKLNKISEKLSILSKTILN